MGRQADDHSDLDLPNMRISSSSAVPPVICRPGLGWSQCVHPEGWVYFQKGNIVTDVAPDRLPEVEGHIATFARVLTNDQYDISVSSSPSNAALNIFFVNHELRYASSNMRDVTESPGLPASQDIRMEYWKFMCHYPSHRPLPLGALAMARQLLDCYIMDGLRRRSESHAPFRLEQSKELLEFLDKMGGTSDDSDIFMTTTAASGIPSRSSSLVALVSWIMLTSARHSELHKYGRRPLYSLRPHLARKSLSFSLVSAICFGSPRSHLHRTSVALTTMKLQGRVDAWREYMEVLHGELGISVLVATVVLTAAIAFLAVPGVDDITLIFALLTISFTLASIMTGIYLQWQTGKIRFVNIQSSLAPLLATLFSIPFALLTWAMVLFTVAVLSYSILGFQAPTDGNARRLGQTTYISIFAFSFAFICIIGLNVFFFRNLRHGHRHAMQRDGDL